MNDARDFYRLLSAKGIGPKKVVQLLKVFDTYSQIFSAQEQQLQSIKGISQRDARAILAPADSALIAGQEMLVDKFNTTVYDYLSNDYPTALKETYDAPVGLFLRGNTDLLKQDNYVAIVGTRNPSTYGVNVTEKIVTALCNAGYGIISGMAKGIDGLAHRIALDNNVPTIGVLGNGVDRVYPKDNAKIYEGMLNKGLLVSEFLMGMHPDPKNFPRRNRIISALSKAVIVIEAGEKSGALITAYYALEQGKEVMAVPGSIFSKNSTGPHFLIKQGAKLVQSIDDILDEIAPYQKKPAGDVQQTLLISLEGSDKKIYDVLSDEPLHIDELARKIETSTYSLMPNLLQLEMKGHITQLPGKYFIRRRS